MNKLLLSIVKVGLFKAKTAVPNASKYVEAGGMVNSSKCFSKNLFIALFREAPPIKATFQYFTRDVNSIIF